jgi:uncharacterized protein YciI
MQFVIEYAVDPAAGDALEVHRVAHLAYRMNLEALRLAAQIKSESGEMIGSVAIIDADGPAEAERIAQGDPFVSAGVYTSVTIRPCEVRYCDLKAGPPA